MKFLNKLLKKFHSEKGITGADIAAAITVIVVTMGVITAIYINVTNKAKENLRYSNATRIATQIIENIQAYTYDNMLYRCNNGLNTVALTDSGKIFDVNIPKGYSATVTTTEVDGAEYDVVRDVKVEVTYKVSNKENKITLYTVKEKELLEQTNKPQMELIDGYSEMPSYYYPVKYADSTYVVTDKNDPEWYNYDEGTFAFVLRTVTEKSIGDTASGEEGDVYVWVPRYGITDNQTSLTLVDNKPSNLGFAYGTSKYKIEYGHYGDLYGYMLVYPTEGIDETTVPNSLVSYVADTFEENDGLAGMWYKVGDTEGIEYNAFTALNNVLNISV